MPGLKSITGMTGTGSARELAEMLRQMGRGRDTVLAHITPEEAQMLMDMGGSGTTNPNTGLPEFQDFVDYGEFYGNVTNQPTDFSYMSTPEFDFGYGEMPTANFNTAQPSIDMTGFRQPTGFEQAMAPQPMPSGMQFDYNLPPATEFGGITGPFERQPISPFARTTLPEQPAAPGFLERGAQTVEDTAAKARELATKYPTVARLLSTGATSLPNLINAIRARREGQRRAEEFRRLGEPLRAQGQALRQQALSGQLTPQQAAQQEAERARLRQSAATRGATSGTQAAMIENQLARQRAQLSETNLNNAIKLLNLGNAYDEEAIRTSLAANQRINQRLENIFSNLGQATAASTAPTPPATPEQTEKRVTQRPQVRES
jgi:hypothetical protein